MWRQPTFASALLEIPTSRAKNAREMGHPDLYRLRWTKDADKFLKYPAYYPTADTGNVTVNTAPPSGEFAASTLPLCSFITDLQMLRPSPVPRPGRFVV